MSFANVAKNPWFMLLVMVFAVSLVVFIGHAIFVQVTGHQPFCESVGLEFDGFGNRKGSMINCVGFNGDKAIVKTYLVENGKYYEVSKS